MARIEKVVIFMQDSGATIKFDYTNDDTIDALDAALIFINNATKCRMYDFSLRAETENAWYYDAIPDIKHPSFKRR